VEVLVPGGIRIQDPSVHYDKRAPLVFLVLNNLFNKVYKLQDHIVVIIYRRLLRTIVLLTVYITGSIVRNINNDKGAIN
jgi:hypothetical protein